jgi:GDP-mannose 6-dehydrogenase
MRVTVFGLGYVGCVTAACLAELGHDVTGVDVDANKVEIVNSGRSPIIEPDLDTMIASGRSRGLLRAVTTASCLGDVAIVCVGTPSNDNGSLSLDQISRAVAEIGRLIKAAGEHVVINIRSTVLPGTVETYIIPQLEATSGKRCDDDFDVCMNPEFMRETTAVEDFRNPPFTVIGARREEARDRVAKLYEGIHAPLEGTSLREAEMIKYACNAFHALKVCFANEIGNICKTAVVDSHRVFDILCKDTKLNLSPYYLKPGFAFGGSCLPKDLRAILYHAKQADLDVPTIRSLLTSNRRQIELAFDMVRRAGKKKIGVLGLSFKAGTDDLRESPIVAVIEMLLGKGYSVSIYDEEVSLSNLVGANRRYIAQTIPHIASLMKERIEEVVAASEVIVVSKKTPVFAAAASALPSERIVIDLVRLWRDVETSAHYEGLCW